VGVQNYIDDTGVQVADVVVGFRHVDGKTYDEVAALARGARFDYYCWDLYAQVGDFYAADPARKKLQAETLHAIEAGDNETARLAELVAARIVECHLATMERLGIRYDLLAHESDILRLHFWDRAFELLKQAQAIRLETEGKNAGCWVLTMSSEERRQRRRGDLAPPERDSLPEAEKRRSVARGRESSAPKGAAPSTRTRSSSLEWHRDLHGQGHRVPALEDGPPRPRLPLPAAEEYDDGHVLWTTTSADGEKDAPKFGHARDVYNVIDTGQSYPQRVVKAGVAALGHAEAAAGTHHLAYEKVVLSPATARAMGYAVSDDETAVKVSGRKGLGVKADDLVDALVRKARGEIDVREDAREGERRSATSAPARPATSPWAPSATSS
jgi:arginyl-tRNA synthetase